MSSPQGTELNGCAGHHRRERKGCRGRNGKALKCWQWHEHLQCTVFCWPTSNPHNNIPQCAEISSGVSTAPAASTPEPAAALLQEDHNLVVIRGWVIGRNEPKPAGRRNQESTSDGRAMSEIAGNVQDVTMGWFHRCPGYKPVLKISGRKGEKQVLFTWKSCAGFRVFLKK